MAPYSHQINTYHRTKRARRFRKISRVVLVIFLIILGFIAYDWFRSSLKNSTVGQSSEATVQSASINIFRTPYFQFQTDKSWREINESSTNKKYVYRSFESILVQHELIVEVDTTQREVLANTQIAHVIPVEILNNTLSAVGAISPHCKTLINDPNDRKQRYISYKETEFPCDPDSSIFVVVAGVVGGNELISYKNTDDTVTTLKITYRDSTYSPNGSPLSSIINSFQIL